ncbi:MAG: hypothetical protein FWH08_01720 [Oscillospiraceae bacterium]|nr:hypothetical protein [Oscillospiraceae bacterium]
MKRAVITAAIVLIIIAAVNRGKALPKMTEITLAEPVFVLGVDKVAHFENSEYSENMDVRFSVVYEKIESNDEGGDDNTNRKYTQSAEASSSAAALERLKKQFPREIAVSTADYFLIGEEAARDNVQKYADFLSKNSNLRLTASVFIVRGLGGSASEAAEILNESKTLDILRNYGENSGINAFSSQMKFYELLSELAVNTRAVAVPALVINESAEGKNVVPNGYAIIKDSVLQGFLDNNSSRGYNIMKNKSVHSIIEIDYLGAATRLETAKRQVKFNFDGDVLTDITVNVTVTASAVDSGGKVFKLSEQDLSREDVTLLMEKEQGRIIFDELQKTVAASKRYNSDFIGFGDLLRIRHPYKWERMKNNWDQIYKQTPVKININSRILK